MKEPVERIEDCDGKQADSLMVRGEQRVKEMRQRLTDKIITSSSNGQCLHCIASLFFKVEKESFSNYISRVADYKTNVRNIQNKPDECSLVEQNLWTLYLWDLYVKLKNAKGDTVDGFSLNDYENMLADCFSTLEGHKNPCMCLMLWLFPKLATKDRIKKVEDILRENKDATWWLRDKMLFWLACLEESNCSQEKAREIERQILELKLDSGAFATVEGKKENGDIISSAIGLLVLISCAKRKDSAGTVADMAQKTVRWIVEQDADGENLAWGFYALSEYVACLDTLGLIEKRDTTGER